jgi:hydrogenase maturation factor
MSNTNADEVLAILRDQEAASWKRIAEDFARKWREAENELHELRRALRTLSESGR